MKNILRRDILKTGLVASLGLGLSNQCTAQGMGYGGGGRGRGRGMDAVPVASDNPAIMYNHRRCQNCGDCTVVCSLQMSVLGHEPAVKKPEDAGKIACIHCGQCTNICYENAVHERIDYPRVQAALSDKKKVVIAITSPAVRVTLGEMFSQPAGTDWEGHLVTVLRKLGFKYVLDATFGADLTISEESSELLRRLDKKTEKGPMFTSCCPAWVTFTEIYYPQFIPNLSSVRSPLLMQGALIKTYFAKKLHLNPEQIVTVAITPCTAKKYEASRPEMNAAGRFLEMPHIRDIDISLTCRELAWWIREQEINPITLEKGKYDSIMGRGSGAGVIFGNSGGVMESALRSAYVILTGKQPPEELLRFTPVRGLNKVREAEILLEDRKVKVAVVHGTNNARKLLEKLKSTPDLYDFVEVMACPGGCIGGGGLPKTEVPVSDLLRARRMAGLYIKDKHDAVRVSVENPEVRAVYKEYLGEVNGERARKLLHVK